MISPDQVCAVLVTRGDVDMQPIIASLPYGEIVVWDNSIRPVDHKVFGRYVGIGEATREIIYFQDDDCIVSCHEELMAAYEPGMVVGNAFDDAERLKRYEGTTLLGWGAIFDWSLPLKAFWKYARYYPLDAEFMKLGCELVFPMLTPNKTILHGVDWLDDDGPVLERPNRMWKQPGFYDETRFWLERARRLKEMT